MFPLCPSLQIEEPPSVSVYVIVMVCGVSVPQHLFSPPRGCEGPCLGLSPSPPLYSTPSNLVQICSIFLEWSLAVNLDSPGRSGWGQRDRENLGEPGHTLGP